MIGMQNEKHGTFTILRITIQIFFLSALLIVSSPTLGPFHNLNSTDLYFVLYLPRIIEEFLIRHKSALNVNWSFSKHLTCVYGHT